MSKAFRTAIPTALVVAGLLLGTAGEAAADLQQSPAGPASVPKYAPGELVVRYRPGTTRTERAALRDGLDATVESKSLLKGLQVLDLPEGTTVRNAVEAARSLPQVLYAEPNYSYRVAASPNDPMFDEMWSIGLQNAQGINSGIDTPRAWNLTTGSPSVTVAVVDTGLDASHPDLAENMWSNTAETAGNGVDDDGNGKVDDVTGWDWVEDDNSADDGMGHGTHVAGIIGARGNNGLGVTGVTWDVSLMPLRVLDATGSGWTNDVADAFAYAGRMGVDIVNASLAGTSYSEAMEDAMASSPETLFVVAAGNSSTNVDLSPTYPCKSSLPNVICVAATGQTDQLAAYSNYGSANVDLAAPGDAILSTWPGGAYSEGWGTSAATPHVAGVAALLAARHPEATMGAIRDAIVTGTQGLPALAGRTVSGGRLSAAGALERMGDVVPQEPQNEDDKRCDHKRRKRHGKSQRHDRRRWQPSGCRARGR